MQRLCQLLFEGPNSWNKPGSTSLSQENCTGQKSIDAYLKSCIYQHKPASAQILLMLTSCKKCGPRMSKCGDQWKKLLNIRIKWRQQNVPCPKVSALWRISRFCPLHASRAAPALQSCHPAPQIQEGWASSWKEGWGVHAFSSHSTKWRQGAQDTRFAIWNPKRNILCRTSGKEMKGVRKQRKLCLRLVPKVSQLRPFAPLKEGKVWFGMSSPKIDKKNLGGWIENDSNDSKRICIDFFMSLLSLCSHGTDYKIPFKTSNTHKHTTTSSLSIWYLLRLDSPVGVPIRCFRSISSKPYCSRNSILSKLENLRLILQQFKKKQKTWHQGNVRGT